MPGLSCELTGTWGSMNSWQSLLQNIPIRDKNVVITWVQLKLQLVLTGIFQLIITETEPSLLCCFVPSSESNQETAQPHTRGGRRTFNVLTVLQWPNPWHARIPDEHHCKEQCWQWKTTEKGSISHSLGLLKQLKPEEEETTTTAGKKPPLAG